MVETGAQIHRVRVGDEPGIELSVTFAGDPKNPTVLLLHGFPEIGYSWRHQIRALVDAGFHVIAPDQRGCGWSDSPDGIEAYDITQLTGDMVSLLDALDVETAMVAGHDWGSIVAWHLALFRPDRLTGLALLALPYQQRGSMSWPARITAEDPEGPFSYMAAFGDPNNELADLLDADVIGSLSAIFWDAAASTRPADSPGALPPHLNAGEFENYCRALARSTFQGPINWYRNLERNWQLTRPWHKAPITVPSIYMGGSEDFVVQHGNRSLGGDEAPLSERFTDLRGEHLIDGAGHWLQQEAPEQVSQLIVDFALEVQR